MTSLLLVALKYLSIALTTCLGALGLLANFRDKETNRVTRAGRLLLAGIITSGAIVLATQALEDARQHAERENVIEQAARGEYPLRNVRLSCWADIPSKEHPQLLAYHARLAANASEARAKIIRGIDVPEVSGWGGTPGQPPNHISVRPGSPYYPNPDTERFASAVIQSFSVVLQFYRTPISTAQHPFLGATGGVGDRKVIFPDLEMTFFTNSNLGIEYYFDREDLMVWASELEADSRSASSSGRIVSLVNLRGAQMFLELTPLPDTHPYEGRRVAPKLRMLQLHVGELAAFWIDIERMTQRRSPRGSVVYEYRFPETIDGILSLTNKG